jgi:hypothetical protein
MNPGFSKKSKAFPPGKDWDEKKFFLHCQGMELPVIRKHGSENLGATEEWAEGSLEAGKN